MATNNNRTKATESNNSKANVYQIITDRIIAELEKGSRKTENVFGFIIENTFGLNVIKIYNITFKP